MMYLYVLYSGSVLLLALYINKIDLQSILMFQRRCYEYNFLSKSDFFQTKNTTREN